MGSRCLLVIRVSGCRRDPVPPARITPFTAEHPTEPTNLPGRGHRTPCHDEPRPAGRDRSLRSSTTADREDGAMTREVDLTDEQWRERLGPEQFEVLRKSATEPAWSGKLLHVDSDGVFHCAGCGAELFSTDNKFESGSGWPSFDRAVKDGIVEEHSDRSFGTVRTEIVCARCGGHLGHVFDDGPTETGQRYCVNSLSLSFSPEDDAS